MHRWIGIDNGSQCYRCGMALDYRSDPDDTDAPATDPDADNAAHSLAWSLCGGPELSRAHHYVLIGAGGASGYSLDCAYGDSAVGQDTLPAMVGLDCVGA